MNSPEQLASLDGQQYLVLRATGPVAEEYDRTQAALLTGSAAGLPHPHTGHVTLRGFFEPERRPALLAEIRTWAAVQPPIDVEIDAVDTFPAPWQIVIHHLIRSSSLVDAYSSLTRTLDATDFRRLGELSVDEWTFHMSLVYAKTLDLDAWAALELAVQHPVNPRTRIVADEVEFVWYEAGAEHSEVIPLAG